MGKKAAAPRPRKPKLPTVANLLPADDAQLFNHCTASWAGFTGNAKLLAAVPVPAAEVTQTLGALGGALQAPPGGPSTTEAIKAAAEKVRQIWHLLARYTQAFIRSGEIEDGGTVVAGVLMSLSNVGKRRPQAPLAAKTTPTPGTALLIILRIMGAVSYTIEWSMDQASWSTATWTKVRYTVTGLTSGKLYYFRIQAYLRDNTTTAWVGPVSLMIP